MENLMKNIKILRVLQLQGDFFFLFLNTACFLYYMGKYAILFLST